MTCLHDLTGFIYLLVSPDLPLFSTGLPVEPDDLLVPDFRFEVLFCVLPDDLCSPDLRTDEPVPALPDDLVLPLL